MNFMKAAFRKPYPLKGSNDIQRIYHLLHDQERSTIPSMLLKKWSTDVVSACTGPNAGITQLDLHSVDMDTHQDIAGVNNWSSTGSDSCCGMSASLYEEDPHNTSSTSSEPKRVGDPIADVYTCVVRGNNTIAAIADGCSWGKKPRLAARCAVKASVEHILANTSQFNKHPSSETLMKIMEEAMEASQKCILEHKATTTTLSIAVTCQMANGDWCLCTASIGDSRVFLYSTQQHTLLEVTVGSHPADGQRGRRNCGGALGPMIGDKPDMTNLSYSLTLVNKGDVVVLMTDGISDNFSHKATNTCVNRRKSEDDFALLSTMDALIPTLHTNNASSTLEPCCQISHNLHRAVQNHCSHIKGNITAKTISSFLLNTAMEISEDKRVFNTTFMSDGISIREKEKCSPEFAKKRQQLVGKLDHATVISVTV